MVLDPGSPSVFDVRVADAELFGELRVFDQMSPVRSVVGIKCEPRIARPVAARVDPIARDAARTAHIRHGRTEHDDTSQKRDSDSPSHRCPTERGLKERGMGC